MATFVLKCTSKSQADTLKRTFHYYTTRTTRIPLLHNTYNAHSITIQHVQHTFHYYTTRTTHIPLLHNTYNTHSIITQQYNTHSIITQHVLQFCSDDTVTALIKNPYFWSSTSVRSAMTPYNFPNMAHVKGSFFNLMSLN